jgi:hypothetical protein
MRFVFYGFGDCRRSLKTIDRQISIYEDQLKKRQENLKKWRKSGIYVELISELGRDMNEVILGWLKRAKTKIEEHYKEEVK